MNWSTRQMVLAISTLIVGAAVVAGAGYVIYSLAGSTGGDIEFRMGLLVVGAITMLMTVLFILASGFSFLGLADSKQPLGLPEGSIRAMISLVLIMIFIIFGVYLFRMVGSGASTYVGTMSTQPNPALLKDKLITSYYNSTDKTYGVWVYADITPDGMRLAQQLLTTVGTLVVAVSGFYFGSSTASNAAAAGAAAAADGKQRKSAPTIKKVTPPQGLKGTAIDLIIEGSGFMSPKSVTLQRDKSSISCTDILSNEGIIRCKALLDADSSDSWDVVVTNADSVETKLAGVFSIRST